MPIYEYQCQKCGYKFEELQKISAKVLKTCPKCRQPKLKRLISVADFHLKGSGWYKTDYAAKAKTKPGEKKPIDKKPAAEKADAAKKNEPAKTKDKTAKN